MDKSILEVVHDSAKDLHAAGVMKETTLRECLPPGENKLAVARWEKYQENGETVANKLMTEWLNSWGTEFEKTCPACKEGSA